MSSSISGSSKTPYGADELKIKQEAELKNLEAQSLNTADIKNQHEAQREDLQASGFDLPPRHDEIDADRNHISTTDDGEYLGHSLDTFGGENAKLDKLQTSVDDVDAARRAQENATEAARATEEGTLAVMDHVKFKGVKTKYGSADKVREQAHWREIDAPPNPDQKKIT